MKRPSKAFEIALSGIACAVATVFLTVGSFSPYLLALGYIVACFALMFPLSQGFIWGNVLAFLGASLLSLLFGGVAYFWKLLPFYAFFGLHPLVNCLQKKYAWKWWLCLPVKALWFDGAAYLCWRFAFAMAGAEWVAQYIVPVVLVGGTVFFIAYDFMIFRCQQSVNAIIKRIRR